jgi:hypothetical protein
VTSRLSLLAGPDALRILRERGLRAGDVDIVPAASGGPKWIALHGIDRFLAGFLAGRSRPLHLVGSSIGAWRMAALAQRDPLAAMARFREAYLDQRFPARPPPRLVSRVSEGVLDAMLGATGAEEILSHHWVRLHVITARARGPLASERPVVQGLGLALAASANALSRRTLGLSLERVVFHTAGDATPFSGWRDLPTRHLALDAANLRAALLASGSIPLALSGVTFPGGPDGVFRDGGLADYHLDLPFPAGDGLILYPHFYPHVVPGWFDKAIRWRRAPASRLRRTLLVAPSPEFVARLPGGRIPDRKDFHRLPDEERLRAWRAALAEGEALGEELGELVSTGRIAERVRPFPS